MPEFINNLIEMKDWILIGLSVILAIISIIYRIKSKYTSLITGLIKDAESDKTLSNEEKMDFVVSYIKDLIPRIFRVVFNEKTLRQISQNIYDDVKAYRDTYIKNKTGLETPKVIEIVNNVNKENKQVES